MFANHNGPPWTVKKKVEVRKVVSRSLHSEENTTGFNIALKRLVIGVLVINSVTCDKSHPIDSTVIYDT